MQPSPAELFDFLISDSELESILTALTGPDPDPRQLKLAASRSKLHVKLFEMNDGSVISHPRLSFCIAPTQWHSANAH